MPSVSRELVLSVLFIFTPLYLMHWGRDKMITSLQTAFCSFSVQFLSLIQVLLKFVPKCPSKKRPWLIQIMARYRIGNKSLSQSMMRPPSAKGYNFLFDISPLLPRDNGILRWKGKQLIKKISLVQSFSQSRRFALSCRDIISIKRFE